MYGEQIKKRVNSQHGDNYSKKNRKNTTTLTSMLVRPLYTVLLLTSIIVVSRAAVLFEDESSFWNYDEANILTLHSPTIKSSKGYNEGLWQKKTSQGKMSQLLGVNEGELDQTTAKEATTTTASLNDMLMKKAQLRHKNGEDNLRKSTTSARRSNNESSDSHNQPKHNPHFTDGTTDAHHHLDAHRNTNTSTNENNNDIHKWKRRKLEEDEEDEEEEEEEKNFEDYFANNKYGFNDYSLRYATCQKVQRFNSAAIQNGANSAMTFNDIVLLRMCPKRRCSSGSGQTGTYGCSTGYGEYVIELEEYVDVYLRYQYDKMRNLCSFCTDCGYYNGRKRRRRHRTRRMDENVDDGGDDFYAYVDDDNADDGNADDGNADDGNTDDGNANAYYQPEDDDYYISAECINYNDECSNAADQCGTGYYQDDDDRDDEEKNQYLNLLNYVGCKQIEQDEDGDDDGDGDGMYLNPYCDPESGTIIMGIFYDSYCSEYAGDSIDVSNYVGVNFDNDLFSNAYSQECLECTQSDEAPYINSNNYYCNNVYENSGKCNNYLAYDLEEDDDAAESYSNQEKQCAFIESIRYGTYDSYGEFYSSSSQSTTSSQEHVAVTGVQTFFIVTFGLICSGCAAYACFIHHQITNLLLRSLSLGLVDAQRSKSCERVGRSMSRNRRSGRSASRKSGRSGRSASRKSGRSRDKSGGRSVDKKIGRSASRRERRKQREYERESDREDQYKPPREGDWKENPRNVV